MPINPGEPTSDIGMMYRQYLQSKGMPLTAENMQRVVSQSQREPGMIAGLSVQQPNGPQAEAPPNLAGASASSSGQMPIPPKPPMPQAHPLLPMMKAVEPSPMPTTMGGGMNVPTPSGPPPSMAGQGAQAQPPPTPPPGQAPAPQQDDRTALGGNSTTNVIQQLLTALGIGGGALAGSLGGRGVAAQPPPLERGFANQAQPQIGQTRQIEGTRGLDGEMPPAIGGPQPRLSGPMTADEPIGNILMDKKPSTPWKGEGADTTVGSGAPSGGPSARDIEGASRNYPGQTGNGPSPGSTAEQLDMSKVPMQKARGRATRGVKVRVP